MRKRNIPFILGVFVLAAGAFFALGKLIIPNKLTNDPSNLINISELSEEFMNDYFDGMGKISSDYEAENILLVVSSQDVTEDSGASLVVKAPNNTYVLGYENEADKKMAEQNLKELDYVFNVAENRKYTLSENDNNNTYNSWGIEAAGLDYATSLINEKGGQNVTAAIIDTGCDMDLFNASFSGKIEEVYNLYSTEIYGNDTMFDNFGHGTHIAGTIAEGTPDNVKILPVKVSDGRSFTSTSILTAINYITYNHKADVINMSFGGFLDPQNYSTDPEYLAIEAAKSENIISVVAAGNEASSMPEAPAAYDNTISISAVDSSKQLAEFSSYGDTVTFAAPGVDILSINGTKSGTSMATPHAVAAVSIIKSINKNLSLSAITEILADHTDDLGPRGRDNYFGYGFINLSDVDICEDASIQSCDDYAVLRKINPVNITTEEIVLTPYNYGSITNILATKIRITSSDGVSEVKRLDELDGVSISGYDPYSVTEQSVTVSYQGLEMSFDVSNPENYELGWEYQDYYGQDSDGSSLSIVGYHDSNLQIKKLYLPSTINDRAVYTLQWGSGYYPHVFGNSNDAKYYQEVYLPDTIRTLGTNIFAGFDDLYFVKSDAEDLEVSGGTFMNLAYLSEVDANILFGEYSSGVFSQDKLLSTVTLSSKNTFVPSASFNGCESLKSIELPSNITRIDSWAFGYSGLESVILPDNLQQIGQRAFAGTRIRDVFIPSSVTKIDAWAFGGQYLENVSVSEGNTVYDSRDDCNAIIDSSTDVLVIGSNQTVIPDSVKEIGDFAFAQSIISSIVIPDGVTSIGDHAFFQDDYLDKITIPASVTFIGDYNFETTGFYTEVYTKIYTYSNTYAHSYAVDRDITYILLDETPSVPDISYIVAGSWGGEDYYLPYEQADLSKYHLKIKYDGIDELDDLASVDRAIYLDGRDSFRHGDTYFHVVFNTDSGYHNLKIWYPVTVGKLNPEYTVPAGIVGNINTTLSDIELPDGFEWEDGDAVLTESGNKVFNARFVPADQENYNIIDNIPIPVEVIDKALLKPTITVENKIYDGTTILSFESINISDIDGNIYSLEDAYYDTANVGSTVAHVVLKLSDEAFINYSFANGLQEKTFDCDAEILHDYVGKPTMREMEYTYNGSEQAAIIDNYNNRKMTIRGNRQTNAGEYEVRISLKNDNYLWEDGTREDLVFGFIIKKANLPSYCLGSDRNIFYDGESHELNLYCHQATIKYMDTNGEYSLDESPSYTDPGNYIIKYMIYLSDDYEIFYGENSLNIYDSIDFAVDNYIVDEPNLFIRGIPAQTTEEDFKANFERLGGIGYIVVDYKEIDGEKIIYTGGKTKVYKYGPCYGEGYDEACQDELYKEYTNVVIGDIDGDGMINSTDLLKLRKHLLKLEILEGPFYKAADIIDDTNVNSADLLMMRKYLINGSME